MSCDSQLTLSVLKMQVFSNYSNLIICFISQLIQFDFLPCSSFKCLQMRLLTNSQFSVSAPSMWWRYLILSFFCSLKSLFVGDAWEVLDGYFFKSLPHFLIFYASKKSPAKLMNSLPVCLNDSKLFEKEVKELQKFISVCCYQKVLVIQDISGCNSAQCHSLLSL